MKLKCQFEHHVCRQAGSRELINKIPTFVGMTKTKL